MEDTHVKSLKPLAAVAVASALALTGCSAGQITQTSNQVAAVDGTTAFTEDRELSVQDATVVLAEDGQAAVKFTVTNQDRSMKDHTLKSVTVEGIGEVELKKVAETPSFAKAAKGENSLPRECQIVAGPKSVIDPLAKTAKDNTGCIAYYTNELDPATLVGDKSSAAGQNREATFEFTDPQGNTNTYDLDITVSADILEAGAPNRGADGMIETK